MSSLLLDIWRRLFACLVCLAAVDFGAVLTPPGLAARQAISNGAISGLVTDGPTGLGLEGVVVSIRAANGYAVRTGTDGRGRFVFPDLPPSELYVLSAAKPGYAPGGIARPVGFVPTTFSLSSGEWIRDVVIPMLPLGSISGTVLDEKGDPAVNVIVRALRRIPVAGNSHWAQIGSTYTDDRGYYRIPGLESGTYVLHLPSVQSSVPRATSPARIHNVREGSTPQVLPPTNVVETDGAWMVINRTGLLSASSSEVYPQFYHPSSRTLREATPVELGTHEHLRGIDLRVFPVPAAAVRGRIVGPPSQLDKLVVRLIPDGAEGLGMASVQATAVPDSGGEFVFPSVPSGGYFVDVRTHFAEIGVGLWSTAPGLTTNDKLEFLSGLAIIPPPAYRTRFVPGTDGLAGRVAITVESSNLAGLEVALEPLASLSGRVVFPDGKPLTRGAVWADVANGDPAGGGGSGGDLGPNGEFTIRGLQGGDYFLRVPPGVVVKSVTAPGGDFSLRPIQILQGSALTTVTITVSAEGATITGAVRDKSGAVRREVVVIVFPVDQSHWTGFGLKPTTLRSQLFFGTQGYRFSNLPAGDYYLAAVEPQFIDAWQDREFLAGLVPLAVRTRLGLGANETKDLVIQTPVVK